MLSYARRALNFEPEREIFLSIADNRDLKISRVSYAGGLSTGLRLVLDQYISNADSPLINNYATGVVLQKQSNIFKSIVVPTSPDGKESDSDCFLSSCHLCKKRLKSGEDVYMYMGDQGFCSVDCRSRQIAMDEMKEVEKALDRRIMATASDASDLPQCPSGGECENCRLLKDLRRRRRNSARRERK
ncbi:hypothetical protein V2J09_023386 [Rumex salicifolius]